MPKKTLLEIVQSILSDMDSEDVNSISDSVEAMQVASIVRDTYFNIITTREVPEHKELLKLTALSDTDYPTHMSFPENVRNIEKLWYEDSDGDYQEITYLDPMDFLSKTDHKTDNYDTVLDKNGSTKIRVGNNEDPRYYTSFDDTYVVFNSYDNAVEDTLQSSKVRAYGTMIPSFSLSDTYTPDIDIDYFPYLIAESKSVAMSLLKGGADPKIDQAARRQKSYIQNDRYKTEKKDNRPRYGR